MQSEKGVKLERNMTLLGGISLVVGSMIGSGIFISPTGIIAMSGSIGSALIIWVICGFIVTVSALCYIEVGIEMKDSYNFVSEYMYHTLVTARLTYTRIWSRI